ncbi:hypothetical protein M2326_003107 [Flavobacterium sp. 7A]|nr:hypothetical protein [Flavobacterium sp. 7A]
MQSVLLCNNFSRLKVKGNTIKDSGTYRVFFPENPALSIKKTRQMFFDKKNILEKENKS